MNTYPLNSQANKTDKTESERIESFIESINSDISIGIKPDFFAATRSISDSEISKNCTIKDIAQRKLVIPDPSIKTYFSKTQKWIGHVISISGQTFKAKLEDLSNFGTDEIGEFDLEEISEEDKSLLSIGAAFYWSLGYSHENGQITKKSIIRFQRISNWSEECLNNASDRANDLSKTLNWE